MQIMASNSINGRKASEIFQGQALLYRHMYAVLSSMSLKWAVELSIPDIIHNHGKPITLPELVSTLQVPPAKVSSVQRLMRYLAHNGFFDIVRIHDNQEAKEAFALTPASELLVKGTEHCLAPMVEFVLDPTLSGSFHHLGKWTFKEELTLFDISLGTGFWDFLNKNPAYNKSFDDAMASDSKMINLALRDCSCVFKGLESIVDVGGGTGTTAKIISETFPELNCIVFDRPQVVENLSGSNNLSYVGGNMFESIPRADAALLKWILHNWSDSNCIKILEKCKDAISTKGKRGKVIIIDIVIKEKQDEQEISQTKLLVDVAMAAVNGKERTEEEWKKFFKEAGFQDYKISPTPGIMSVIEVYP